MPYTATQKNHLQQLFSDKSTLILGAQREGLSTLKFLRHFFPTQTLYLADLKTLNQFSPETQELLASDPNLILHLGTDYLDYLSQDQIQVIVKAPGIPASLPQLQTAFTTNSALILTSQIQLFLELCPCPTIGITGTKGKSTTTSVIYHILKTNNLHPHLAGNIGIPALSQLEEITSSDLAVLELSSHQLAELTISPHIAVIQDIQPEHLDYYPDFAHYVDAKAQIALHQQPDDFIIFDPDFKQPARLAAQSPATHLTYSLAKKPGTRLYFTTDPHPQAHYFDLTKPRPHHLVPETINLAKLPLSGKHNLLNIAPGILIGFHFGLTTHQIETALNSFTPLHHRLEFIAEINHVSYYNDSMATTPEAAQAALSNFPPEHIILLAGGSEKNSNYHPFAQQILDQKVKKLFLFPPTGTRIKTALEEISARTQQPLPEMTEVLTMADAVSQAAHAAKPGDIVLLSPASASFGLFKDAYDRGDQFTAAVKNLV